MILLLALTAIQSYLDDGNLDKAKEGVDLLLQMAVAKTCADALEGKLEGVEVEVVEVDEDGDATFRPSNHVMSV